MRKILNGYTDSLKDPLNRVLLLFGVIAALLPVNKVLIPGFLVLTFISCLFLKKVDISRTFIPLYLLALIFVLHLSGMLYSEHIPEAKKELEYKMSYMVFPLLSLVVPSFRLRNIYRLLDVFTLGCMAFALGSVAWGIKFYLQTGELTLLSYGELSHPFHPTYMAVYHTLAMTWVLYRLSFESNKTVKSIGIVCLMTSGAYIMMLASKAGILSMGIPLLFGVFFFSKEKNLKGLILPLMACTIFSWASFKLIPTSGERIDAALKTVTTGTSEADSEVAHSSVKLRQVVWKASLKLILENPFGVGTGDTTPELVKEYEKMGETYAAERNLNCHNQFLQVTSEHGWPALLLLVASMAMMLIRSIKRKEWIFMAFLLICGFNFLFESFLEVQAGIVFFCFFSLVFLNTNETQAS
ncbi:MAG: O-antigen ligase family protein [Flavobacteriales bacterium]|nr:O-antigen ligase family protein [Flavobacteriales bacterium]